MLEDRTEEKEIPSLNCLGKGREFTWTGSKQGLNAFEGGWFRCGVNGVQRSRGLHCRGVHRDRSE